MAHTIHADLGPLDKIMKKPTVGRTIATSAPLAAIQDNLRSMVDLPAKKTSAEDTASNVAVFDKGYLKGTDVSFAAGPDTELALSLAKMVDRRVVKA